MSPAIAPGVAPTLPSHLRTMRVTLSDGCVTTVHVAEHELSETRVRVVRLARPEPLGGWCARTGVEEALVGGFFTRPNGRPLGELRTHGIVRGSTAFTAPWNRLRPCLHVDCGNVSIVPRHALCTTPRGDLLQAGPLLVRDGVPVARDGEDPEGFSAASDQFDSDITEGRHPRAALALASGSRLLAVVCDGRDVDDAGLMLPELATLLAELGAEQALNLDGGGSASLVCGGRLRNVPRGAQGVELAGGRPISTAVAFSARL
ncbi:MAG TPA: phosphodiester glycosidase family protein [Conexibacter sp.]|jgi:hypothetical protein